MLIPVNKQGLPNVSKYGIDYNRNTKKFDVYYYAEWGLVPLYPVESYLAGEEAIKSFVAGWNAAEHAYADEHDIQSDEMPEADELPPQLQDLRQDMDATELQEAWDDYSTSSDEDGSEESGEPDVPYERIREPYDPIRYE